MATTPISVTLDSDTLEQIRERVGKRGVSAFLDQAARRQLEREDLDELIGWMEEVNGPTDPETIAANTAILRGEA